MGCHKGIFLSSITKNEINKERNFEHKKIDYDQIKYEIARMEHVEYNTMIRRNVTSRNDKEDFSNIWWH